MSNRSHLRPRGGDGASLMGDQVPVVSPLQGLHGQRLLQTCVEVHAKSRPCSYEIDFVKDGNPVVFRVTVEIVDRPDNAEP